MAKTGFNFDIFYAISQLQVTFKDGAGNPLRISGTGFWVNHKTKGVIFITNKHNFVPEIKDAKYKEFKIIDIAIQFRAKENGKFTDETNFIRVDLESMEGSVHVSADVAVLMKLGSKNFNPKFGFLHIAYEELADQDFLTTKAMPLDPMAFIGFPQKWYDQIRQMPIARIAYIANDSSDSFKNSEIKTTDVTLVSGLSFGGSSGSPAILLQKGIGIQTSFSPHVLPKIIGIMSGHSRDIVLDPRIEKNDNLTKGSMPLLSAYSGLSYYTRSTSIHELINNENTLSIKEFLCSSDEIKIYESAIQI